MKQFLACLALLALGQTHAQGQEIPAPVLLLYGSPQLSSASLSQRIQETKAQEALVFGKISLAQAERKTLWLLHGTIASLTKSQLREALGAKAISSLYFLGRVAHLPPPSPLQALERTTTFTWGWNLLGLPQLRQAHPLALGTGVRLGLIDTGIDPTHTDLKGRTLRFRNFLQPDESPFDDNGHGTHVAGTIVGGAASSINIGIAPQAGLVVAKAFSARGSAQDADLLLALQWMADPDGDPLTADGVRVINNSWNFSDAYGNKEPEDEPFCLAIEKLHGLGILSVFSAGNSGPGSGSVEIPGACPYALTVGASDENDSVAGFSSRGPVRWRKTSLAKPEIVAPGVKVLSAAPGMFATLSGTSMAAPHVTGALALLAQAHPNMGPSELRKEILRHTKDIGPKGPDAESGFGRLDLHSFFEGGDFP